MDRKQFEEWFKTTDAYKLLEEMNYFKIDLFIFKEHRSQYQHTTVQIAYMTWQHQQAKVEELQEEFAEDERFLKEQIQQKDITISGLKYLQKADKELIQALQIKTEKMQKRVDALVQKCKDEDRELKLIDEWEQSTIYGRIAIELEQALKGEG